MKVGLSKIAVILGAVVGASVSATMCAVGCGGDSGAPQQEEGGADSTVDSTFDVGSDTQALDAVHPDVGTEAGSGRDAADAGAADDATDSSDFTNIGDVQIDVPPLAEFPHAVIEAYCSHLQDCCIMSQDIASPDQWNQDGDGGCAPFLAARSGAFGIGNHGAALDSGLVTYDATASYTCLREWLSFQCGTVSAAGLQKVKNDCYGAMAGTLGINAGPCIDSIQCKSGEYCRLGDAGNGTCVPLSGLGQPCADTTNSFDCSYLGLGNPAQYCAALEGGSICQNALPSDAGCTTNATCQAGVCIFPRCVDTTVFSSTPVCRLFQVRDAGGGG